MRHYIKRNLRRGFGMLRGTPGTLVANGKNARGVGVGVPGAKERGHGL